jgi:excisionase family DNA binding protein
MKQVTGREEVREYLSKRGGPREVAKLLGLSRQAVYKWIPRGKIPELRLWQIQSEEFEKFLHGGGE